MTDISERGLENMIIDWLVERNHYEQGSNDDYSREYSIDEARLLRFLNDTQKEELTKSRVLESEQKKREFWNFLPGFSQRLPGGGLLTFCGMALIFIRHHS